MDQGTILTSQKIQEEVLAFQKICQERGIPISQILLFGSYAKGSPKPWSDVDLAVISPSFKGSLIDKAIELKVLSFKIDPLIEPHPFLPEDFNSFHPLISEIKKYGRPISSLS